jgi:hypothetical protein
MYINALQASECYSPTSSQARVLVVQATIAAYPTRFTIKFFSYNLLNARKQRNDHQQATYRTTFCVSSTKNSFFNSQVAVFTSDPSCLRYWLLHPLFFKEATCKGSTVKGLPYAAKAVLSKDYFMHLTLTIARKGH